MRLVHMLFDQASLRKSEREYLRLQEKLQAMVSDLALPGLLTVDMVSVDTVSVCLFVCVQYGCVENSSGVHSTRLL